MYFSTQDIDMDMIAKQVSGEHSYASKGKVAVSSSLETNQFFSFPVVIHVMEKNYIDPDTGYPSRTFFIPTKRGDLLYPHWLHCLLDKDLRFYTSLHEQGLQDVKKYQEGQMLVDKMRYISAKFSWDPNHPVGMKLFLAENHGNCRLPRRRKQKPLLADCVIFDCKTDCVAIQGSNFSMTVGLPYPGDVIKNREDLGSKIDVGLFSRALDCAPHLRAKWYISLLRKEIPKHALEAAYTDEDEYEDDDDDDETIDGDEEDEDDDDLMEDVEMIEV